MDIKQAKECPDCASMNIVKSAIREQIICRECGLIQPLVPVLKPAKKAKKPAKKAKKKAVKKKAKKRKK
ncbi:hypothetical protein KY309_02050 [Candidatus Woesearchaeota archaeon]|nr:hypothetical protein [Candidatus Woesearchaeota archaeon]MBW3016370.1 hypothetical protein [Candidatus Woesearchaeota archaeon]